ncbi:hypothetical protein DLAC_00458 [Tieghemostelium lacteum]|uniref:Phosphatidate cytidylyltransferase n=1 Tax=Tieghemostelium lacteum TaxID=361077 RepID=A0A152A9T4_TIELA|nr:hypothetical protein DLAC_00458 [Tieghemostelium lacteum]|eukprot:KYR02974.1 hypothetical protein DLAC_00458 [Tieghemostelium lacteum]
MIEEEILLRNQEISNTSTGNNNGSIGNNWYMLALFMIGLFSALAFANTSTRKSLTSMLRYLGIGVKRVPRVIKELKRKGFHFSGLVIPLIYLLGLNYSTFITRKFAYTLMGAISLGYFIWECLRVYVPPVGRFCQRVYGHMMREKEKNGRFNGVLFYLIGTAVSLYMFSPLVAIACSLFLIIGDFCAALVGISYGKTKIGNKSLEGSLAMFAVCFFISLGIFWSCPLVEQLSLYGALSATLVELLNPSFIDDNLTIPCLSGLAIHLIAARLQITIPDPSIMVM